MMFPLVSRTKKRSADAAEAPDDDNVSDVGPAMQVEPPDEEDVSIERMETDPPSLTANKISNIWFWDHGDLSVEPNTPFPFGKEKVTQPDGTIMENRGTVELVLTATSE